MNAEIISIGTELMRGGIINTNAQYLARTLSDLGFSVRRQTTVGDNPEKLKEAFTKAIDEYDLVISSGGLGPTQDDLTKNILAEVLGVDLVLNEEAKEDLEKWAERRNFALTENNYRQVYLPEGAEQIKNHHGSAPGILCRKGNTRIILLPGPPAEMKYMFEESVREILEKLTDTIVVSEYINTTGIGESTLETELYDLIDNQDKVSIATYAKPDEVLVRVTAAGNDEKEIRKLLEPVVSEIKERIGVRIFSNSSRSIPETVTKALIDKEITLSTAESCTGGQLSSTITAVPGSSESFLLGVASYAPKAKERILNIDHEIIEKFGTVSYQTCYAMCENIRDLIGSDIAVSITGVAGPDTSEDKPVGLVYIGISSREGFRLVKNRFQGTRDEIRLRAVNSAFKLIRSILFSQVD